MLAKLLHTVGLTNASDEEVERFERIERPTTPIGHFSFFVDRFSVLSTPIVVLLATVAMPIFSFFLFRQMSLNSALDSLEAQVAQVKDLFDAPSPSLQVEFLGRSQTEPVRRLVSTLYERRNELAEPALERAALLAFALEDYQRASAFVDTGLNKFSDDKRLLAARGLIEYEQSAYRPALSSFQKAAASTSDGNANFAASVKGNEGLAYWELGETKQAEDLLSDSLSGLKANEQSIYIRLNQAYLYADYGEAEKSYQLTNEASRLVNLGILNQRGRIYQGRILRQQAELKFLRGSTKEAREDIEKAILIHEKDGSLLEWAQDKVVKADIEEQTGMYPEALATRGEVARIYDETGYVKGRSENQLKKSHLLIELDRYDEAKELIEKAAQGFATIQYERGSGEAETQRGIFLLKKTSYDFLKAKGLSESEMQKLSEEAAKQINAAIDHFEAAINILQRIGYRRGVAYAEDKLAYSLVLFKQAETPKKEFSEAVQTATRAIKEYQDIGDKRGQCIAYSNLGNIFRIHKEYGPAESNLKEALRICTEIDYKLGVAKQLLALGKVSYANGQRRKAKEYFSTAREGFMKLEAERLAVDEIDDYLNRLSGK